MDSDFFLVQRVDLVNDGNPIKGMEIIGRLQIFGVE